MNKTLLYGAVGLAGAEVTGITNFTGASGSSSPVQMPDIKLPKMGAPNVAIERSGSDGKNALLAAIAQNQSSSGNQTLSMINTMQKQQNELLSTFTELNQQTQNQSPTDYTNPEYWKDQIPDTPDIPGDGDSGNGSNSGSSGGLDLQDYGTPGDGIGVGDIFAITGESGKAAGETVDATVSTAQKAGKTWAETAKALTGREYNTQGTFANNGKPESRRIYQGSLVNKALGEDSVVNNIDGNVTESIGRQFDNKKGGGVIDGVKETFGL